MPPGQLWVLRCSAPGRPCRPGKTPYSQLPETPRVDGFPSLVFLSPLSAEHSIRATRTDTWAYTLIVFVNRTLSNTHESVLSHTQEPYCALVLGVLHIRGKVVKQNSVIRRQISDETASSTEPKSRRPAMPNRPEAATSLASRPPAPQVFALAQPARRGPPRKRQRMVTEAPGDPRFGPSVSERAGCAAA